MFTNQDIIAIAFRLINFIALIGVAFFLFKKHLMPDLINNIMHKKNNQDSLTAQQAALEKQQLNLDALLKEDSLMCQNFRSKIDTWKKIVILEYEAHKKERDKAMIMSNKRTAHIVLQREHNRIRNSVTHNIVINLKKSLSLHFKDPQQDSEFLTTIVKFMDERKI